MQVLSESKRTRDPFLPAPQNWRLRLEPGWLLDADEPRWDAASDPSLSSRTSAAPPHEETRRRLSRHQAPHEVSAHMEAIWRANAPAVGRAHALAHEPSLATQDVSEAAEPAGHPLVGSAWLHGLPENDLEMLTALFRRATPRSEWASRQAAVAHLGNLVPVWPVRSWSSVRGLHVVLGAGGSGKTTLLIKLARHLQAANARVALISLFPEHTMQAAAFKAAANELRASAALVATEDEWRRALETLAHAETILVDTPCFFSDPGTARRIMRLDAVRRPQTVVHQTLCLHHERAFLQRQLDVGRACGVDFVALPKADLASGPASLISLQLQSRRRALSLLNADPHVDGALVPFGTDAVFAALRPAAR